MWIYKCCDLKIKCLVCFTTIQLIAHGGVFNPKGAQGHGKSEDMSTIPYGAAERESINTIILPFCGSERIIVVLQLTSVRKS